MSNAQSGTPAGPYVVMQGGVLDGEMFPLKEGASLIIGSGRLADIQVASGDVSSAHLKITWDESGLYLTDNASFTGTFVNDEQVETAVLWDGDVIGFAPKKDKPKLSTLTVRVPAGSVVVTAPPPEPQAPMPKPTESPKAEPPPPARKTAPVPRNSGSPGRSGRRRGGGIAIDPKILTIVGAALGVLLLLWLGTCVFRGRSPVLSGIDPPLIEPGQNLTMTGLRFSENAQDNRVRFGETEGKVVSASTESLTVTVPEVPGVRAGQEIPVTVEVGGRRSGAVQLRIRLTPKVFSLIPDVALPGETVTARGQGLDAAGLAVTVEDRPAVLLEASNDSARFRVPDLPLEPSRSATVVFKAEERAGKPMTLMIGRLPLLVGVEPNRVDVGGRLTLRGRGFSLAASENRVSMGGATALVVGAKADALDVAVPDIGGGAAASVTVAVAGRTTAPFSFTVSGPSTQWFRLRFFGAVVAGSPDRAAIATALGPLLLLQGKDNAASVAERASSVAASLNEVAESMRGGKAVTLEARSLPEPSIGIVGVPEALVRVLPDDLAGYEAPPDLARSVRPTAQQLADHWAALLNDYLGALVAGHRPFRLCTVTPRAGALVQALIEMGWKPGGGVEPARAYSLGAETGRRLRELALVPAKPGQAIPGLAVEGKWEGEATEAGATKSARLQLRMTGGRLTGSLVLGSGVAMEIPIRDAAVQAGTLVFSYRQARSTPVWVATVGADSLTGEIHEGSPSGPVGGQFTLRFAP